MRRVCLSCLMMSGLVAGAAAQDGVALPAPGATVRSALPSTQPGPVGAGSIGARSVTVGMNSTPTQSAPEASVAAPPPAGDPAEAPSVPPAVESAPIATDRPSFSACSTTVGAGVVQVESGVYVETCKSGGPAQVSTPVSWRIGTGPNSEIRVETQGQNWLGGVSGFADVAVGAKWHLADTPSLGLLVGLTVPSGAVAFRGPGLEAQLRVLVESPLSEDWTLFANAGVVSSETAGHERFLRGLASLGFSRTLTDSANLYVEGSLVGPDVPGGPTPTSLDVGLQYRPSPDLQLDLAVYRGLSGYGLDWGFTAGLSGRF